MNQCGLGANPWKKQWRSYSRKCRTRGDAAPSADVLNRIQEFLAFKLGNEEYGMDILRVQEIRSYEKPTGMANTPNYILGVVNLRGVIVPIVDMRIKFNLSKVDYDTFTVVIVITIGKQVIGMVVDGVSDVIAFTPEQLRPVPQLDASLGTDYILAIGSVQDRMLFLLDIEKLMASAEMGLMAQSVH